MQRFKVVGVPEIDPISGCDWSLGHECILWLRENGIKFDTPTVSHAKPDEIVIHIPDTTGATMFKVRWGDECV